MGKIGTMLSPRRIPLLRSIIAITLPFIDVIILACLSVEGGAAEGVTRSVELGQNHFQHLGYGTRMDDVFYSPPSPRHLLLDASTFSNHLPNHEQLSTSYEGNLPSTSLEFTLENHNSDGEYAIISGLGLNVQILNSIDDASSTEGNSTLIINADTPCRVKVYTKRGEGLYSAVKNTGKISADDVMAYELALDARVLCKGRGIETRLPSALFAANFKLMKQKGPVVVETGEDASSSSLQTGSQDMGGGDRGRRTQEGTTQDSAEVVGPSVANNENITNMIANSTSTVSTYGLSPEEKDYPILIPPNESLSVYIVVMALDDLANGASFLILSSDYSAVGEEDEKENSGVGEASRYKSDTTLDLYSGLAIINAVNATSPSSTGIVDEQKVLQIAPGAIFNGAIYYDTLSTSMTLSEYYDWLEYSLLPEAGCEKSLQTGMIETVGSYGMMFDVTSAVPPDDGNDDEDAEGSMSRFNNVEIFGMDLYMLNVVNASFEVYVRKNTRDTPQEYMSYLVTEGQTSISTNWDMVAMGKVQGKGSKVYTPIPVEAWKKAVVIRPGETVGFYVTVKGSPDLRYRNSSLPEGSIYESDGVLSVGVGRSWGEYPLREDGTDVFFPEREFSGAFHYHLQEGLREFCDTMVPSVAPGSYAPTISAKPTTTVLHSYAEEAKEIGMCPEKSTLETTFLDGTGSYGALFDVFAKKKVMLTGIDFNMDWNTGTSANILVYARQGSWYGHQNSAESWPHLLVNTTLSRPAAFHNRSKDGPYINIDQKRSSAVVPQAAFTPLEMKIGEVWSLYVCTSLADFRYTLGTKLGEEFASNSELSVKEGAGAADWPPFLSGTPAVKGVEYTFYAPRLFNGNLKYDHVDECPSAAPSSMYSTSPTKTPMLTTNVTYTFYVEHSPEKSWSVNQDMSSGVRAVLDRFLGGKDDVLHGYVIRDELVIDSVVASAVSPSDIGYLCHPTPPKTCTPISVLVTASHRSTASTEDVTFDLMRQSIQLPPLIDVKGYTIQYVGKRAVETASAITVSGVPSREMEDGEKTFFENVARDFLQNQTLANENLKILSVTIDGQEITTTDTSTTMPELEEGKSRRRRLQGSNTVQVSVKGTYQPPPELDFGQLVENSINSDRELLQKELKKPPPLEDDADNTNQSDYFEKAEVQGAIRIEMTEPVIIIAEQDDFLNLVAMGIGGLIGALSFTFFLRPHRRQAIFTSSTEKKLVYLKTQPVTTEDQGLLMKRGWGSAKFTESTSFRRSLRSFDSEKVPYNKSDHMLRYSEILGPGSSINERASFASGGPNPQPPGIFLSMSDRSDRLPQNILLDPIPQSRRHEPPHGESFNSMPPVRRGPPPSGTLNQSAPTFREGGGGLGNHPRASQRGGMSTMSQR